MGMRKDAGTALVRLANRILDAFAGLAAADTVWNIGVIDFQGTPPFTVYYDDNTLTTVSAWSCDGWGSASCPFTVLGLPAAPSGLTVR